jgi:hypothetical protein
MKVAVVTGAKAVGREAAELLDDDPRHDRADKDRVAVKQRAHGDLVHPSCAVRVGARAPPLRPELVCVAAHDAHPLATGDRCVIARDLALEIARKPRVVGVEQRHKLSGCSGQSEIPRTTDTQVA